MFVFSNNRPTLKLYRENYGHEEWEFIVCTLGLGNVDTIIEITVEVSKIVERFICADS